MARQNVQIVLVAVALIGAAGMAAAQTEELVRTIPMEPGGRFTLSNLSGEITLLQPAHRDPPGSIDNR